MSRYFNSCFLLLFSSALWGQTIVDSLIKKVPQSQGKERVWLLSDISYYSSSQDAEKSILYAKKCLEAAKEIGDQQLVAEGYNALGIAWFAHGDYDKALTANKNALKIREKNGEAKGLISSYNKIANCYHELGNYSEAVRFNMRALKLSETNGFNAYSGMLLTNIGEIYKAQQKYEEALRHYDQAIKIARESKDTLAWVKALNNAGVAYRELGKYSIAEKSYRLGLKIISGKEYGETEGALLLNLGVLASKNGENERAFTYYRKALRLTESGGDRHGLAVAYKNLGSTYLKIGKPDSALYFLEKSVLLSQELNLKSQLLESYQGLEVYYKSLPNYEQAFYYDSLAEDLKDTLLNIENSRILEELNIRYATEKKEKQLAQQHLQIEKDASRIKSIVLSFTVFALVVVLLGIIVIQRQRSLKRRVLFEKIQAQTRLKEEKLRISRDLHDNIGSQLTLFKIQLEHLSLSNENQSIAPVLKGLSDQTKTTIKELRESIWTIQSGEVSLEELIGKVATTVQQLKNGSMSIVIENRLDESDAMNSLSPAEAIAIFRVIQEAINNSVKHSSADKIIVIFDAEKIFIRDNGIGFNREKVVTGYGLLNMEARLNEVGINISIFSKPDEGTEVYIPLKKGNTK